ncbi:hypothetical protein H8356DRAFT_1423090 [Neocallimastix lanati (nom. inval.)]|nr:hypothetical protein H8356DRAFT_1423090 [Neocallimastix sp. JGI-2020a]
MYLGNLSTFENHLNSCDIKGDGKKSKHCAINVFEVMPRASTRQKSCLELFRWYKLKLTRSVNDENAVRQTSRVNVFKGTDHNFFQIVNSIPNHKNSF